MDYELLRAEGIRHLEELASHIWTDFNAHDPGITILEVLCYAITDLGYRANLPIADLLASPNADKSFFAPLDMLSNRAFTANDYRKLFIDVNAVKNAWVYKHYSSPIADEPPHLNGLYLLLVELRDGETASEKLKKKSKKSYATVTTPTVIYAKTWRGFLSSAIVRFVSVWTWNWTLL